MKKFNLQLDSCELGKSESFFCVLKKTNPLLYRFCCFYSKRTLTEGYNKLLVYYRNLLLDIQKIHYSFKNTHSFCKWLCANGFYATDGSAQAINAIFNDVDRINTATLLKYKKIKRLWNKNDKLSII